MKAHMNPSIPRRGILALELALAGLLLAAVSVSVARATTIYTDQTTFLNNVRPGYYLETFDSLPKGNVVPPLAFSANGFSYTAAPAAFNFFNVGPGTDVWLSTSTSNLSIIFNMTSGNVTAAGGYFFLTAFLGNVTTGTVTATINDGSTSSILNPNSTSFIGFTPSSPILSLTVTPTVMPPNTNVFMTANDFIVGTAAVPDTSGGALLLGVGLLGLICIQSVLRSSPAGLTTTPR